MDPGVASCLGASGAGETPARRDFSIMSIFALQTRALHKRYGRRLAVAGLDLRVPAGCIYGFLGPNGAGKSTTIRMLLGLIKPTSGSAEVLGRPVRWDDPGARRDVGALVEGPAFVDYLSARQNLLMLARLSGVPADQSIAEVLRLVGLVDRQHDRVRTFSHGMKQRLGIAQALLPRPRLLILDEPAQGLDPQGLVEIRDLLLRLRDERGMTIFLSSHLLHEVQLICDQVGVISAGRLIAGGPVAELLKTDHSVVRLQVDDLPRALTSAAALPYVESAQSYEDLLQVTLPPHRTADLNTALVNAGFRIAALIPHNPDLEDLYLKLMKPPAT